MIFFANNDGTIFKTIPQPVYQGGAGVNNIYLVAPFAATLSATVAFQLPNGIWTTPQGMTKGMPMTDGGEIPELINKETGNTYAVWSYTLPSEITRYYGTVTAQFFWYGARTGVVTASAAASFPVGRGVPQVLPTTPTQDIYEDILSTISALQEDIDSGENPARSIYAWNSTYTYGMGEIVWYPSKGEYGAFLESLVSDNTTAPYNAEGVLSSNWKEIVDFNVLNDLYYLQESVSESAEAAQNAAKSAQKSAGNAAQSAGQAAESATAANAAAQSVEDTKETLNGILDGTIAVQKATEDGAGGNIAQQFAQVNSDLEGIREDISNESHFRGMFESVDDLKAKYPTATPNDYAYIVGGDQWIYQDGEWTDSGVPSPNTSVPASDSTPLMDGTASAGSLSQYARGDHRHPSDTTKADTDGTYPNMTVGQSAKLSTARTIDGVQFDGSSNIIHYVKCDTSENTSSKVINIDNFVLIRGAKITVYFSNGNNVNSPKLNVNGTGAKNIYVPGENSIRWKANTYMTFTYDGTVWVCITGYDLLHHPVGSHHIQYAGESTPASLFGGTWEVDTDYAGRTSVYYGTANNPNFKGVYSTQTQYYVNDIVGYPSVTDESLYLCIKDGKNAIPGQNTDYWVPYKNGAIGGSADAVIVNHTHNITYPTLTGGGFSVQQASYRNVIDASGYTNVWSEWNTSTSESSKAVSDGSGKNMQPYIVDTMWKRTA